MKMSERIYLLFKQSEELLAEWDKEENYDLLNEGYPFLNDFNEISLKLLDWSQEVDRVEKLKKWGLKK